MCIVGNGMSSRDDDSNHRTHAADIKVCTAVNPYECIVNPGCPIQSCLSIAKVSENPKNIDAANGMVVARNNGTTSKDGFW